MLSGNWSGYTGENLPMNTPNARGSTRSYSPVSIPTTSDEFYEQVKAILDETYPTRPEDSFNPGDYEFSNVDTGFGGFKNKNLKTLLGEVLKYSVGGDIDPYMRVGSASDIENVNPYTDAAFHNAYGVAKSSGGALNAIFSGNTPEFMQSIMDRAAQSAGNIYSSGNALYSGAAQENITNAAMEAGNESLSQYINSASEAFQGAANITGGLGQAEYFSPTYTQNPFFMSPMQAWSLDQTGTANAMTNITGALSSAADILGAVQSAPAPTRSRKQPEES